VKRGKGEEKKRKGTDRNRRNWLEREESKKMMIFQIFVTNFICGPQCKKWYSQTWGSHPGWVIQAGQAYWRSLVKGKKYHKRGA